MKLNLPSTWTSQKISSLLLLSLLKVNEVKTGEIFANCLISNGVPASAYSLLTTFPFSSQANITASTYLVVCCDKSPCYVDETCTNSVNANVNSASAGFYCWQTANQVIFCESGPHNCGGIVGNSLIASNYTSSSSICPSISTMANKLAVVNPNNGYYQAFCAGDSNCVNVVDSLNSPASSNNSLDCYFDNSAWTCDDCFFCTTTPCVLQWTTLSLASISSSLPSSLTTSGTIISNSSSSVVTTSSTTSSTSVVINIIPPNSSVVPSGGSTNNPNLIPIIAPVGTVVGVASISGLTYCLLKRKRNNQPMTGEEESVQLQDMTHTSINWNEIFNYIQREIDQRIQSLVFSQDEIVQLWREMNEIRNFSDERLNELQREVVRLQNIGGRRLSQEEIGQTVINYYDVNINNGNSLIGNILGNEADISYQIQQPPQYQK